MKNKKSSYARKFSRRVSAGKVYYTLPVNAKGDPTLNPEHQVFEADKKTGKKVLKTRQFTRTARADEVDEINKA